MYNVKSGKNNTLEVIKFVALMVSKVENLSMRELPHPSYIIENFNTDFTGLDLGNQERVKEYCRLWHIDIDKLITDRNEKMGIQLNTP